MQVPKNARLNYVIRGCVLVSRAIVSCIILSRVNAVISQKVRSIAEHDIEVRHIPLKYAPLKYVSRP